MILDNIKRSIDHYVKDRIPTGDFLRAVLENDLFEACARADIFNKIILFDIVEYIYNEIPSECWGSPEKVKTWLSNKEKKVTENG